MGSFPRPPRDIYPDTCCKVVDGRNQYHRLVYLFIFLSSMQTLPAQSRQPSRLLGQYLDGRIVSEWRCQSKRKSSARLHSLFGRDMTRVFHPSETIRDGLALRNAPLGDPVDPISTDHKFKSQVIRTAKFQKPSGNTGEKLRKSIDFWRLHQAQACKAQVFTAVKQCLASAVL